jgi:hypothetical protein
VALTTKINGEKVKTNGESHHFAFSHFTLRWLMEQYFYRKSVHWDIVRDNPSQSREYNEVGMLNPSLIRVSLTTLQATFE